MKRDSKQETKVTKIVTKSALSFGDRIGTREFLKRFGAGISERQARRDLGELEDAGFLERVGAGPTTAYERTEKPR